MKKQLSFRKVEGALRAVDRADFVPKELHGEAYEDYALPIGFGATISQPTTVAFMLEKLDVKEGQKVLDVGSGSGWTTALLAYLVGKKGRVIGVEIIPELVTFGQKNLAHWYSNVLKNNRIRKPGRAEIRQAEKVVKEIPSETPFARILVSAAAKEIPRELLTQLAPNGVLVIPIGAEHEVQKIVRIHKKRNGEFETQEFPGFVFVPLR